MNADVLIVGAGASGLMAARELSKAGKKVVMLEARDRIGGRIYPLSEKDFGYAAQGGAEFMHGAAPVSKKIFEEAGITLIHPTEWWDVRDEEPHLLDFETLSPHDSVLEQKLLALTEDMSVADFFDRHMNEPAYEVLKSQIFRRTEGYDAGDPKRISVFSLRDEITGEDGWHQMNLKEGYTKLLKFFERELSHLGVEIVFKKEVTEINYAGESVVVTCRDGSTYEALKVIVTVPLPVIETIGLNPRAPEKIMAASKIGFGGVIKVLMRFKTKWWSGARQKNFERMFFLFSNEKIPTWWTQYPEPHLTLTGWVAGPSAIALGEKSEEEIKKIALDSLSAIFKIPLEELQQELLAAKVVNWQKDPYAKGAYSYPTPQTRDAVVELKKPLQNKVYFAGEALAGEPASATVEGALQSGQEVAKEVLLH